MVNGLSVWEKIAREGKGKVPARPSSSLDQRPVHRLGVGMVGYH